MLETSYRRLQTVFGADSRLVHRLAYRIGDPEVFGLDRPIRFSRVLDALTEEGRAKREVLNDALWMLAAVREGQEEVRDRVALLLACDCVERVLPCLGPRLIEEFRPYRTLRRLRAPSPRAKDDAEGEAVVINGLEESLERAEVAADAQGWALRALLAVVQQKKCPQLAPRLTECDEERPAVGCVPAVAAAIDAAQASALSMEATGRQTELDAIRVALFWMKRLEVALAASTSAEPDRPADGDEMDPRDIDRAIRNYLFDGATGAECSVARGWHAWAFRYWEKDEETWPREGPSVLEEGRGGDRNPRRLDRLREKLQGLLNPRGHGWSSPLGQETAWQESRLRELLAG